MFLISDPDIAILLRRAWSDSKPGTSEAHEEGGFVCRDSEGSFIVVRWQQGKQNEITVPDHPGGRCDGMVVVASFHTHPNIGEEYLQEPSPTDLQAVRDDPDLSHSEYQGEYVISFRFVCLIRRSGRFEIVGKTSEMLQLTEAH
jgi:hypothetical protein